jgi:hypothetical protein
LSQSPEGSSPDFYRWPSKPLKTGGLDRPFR